MIYRTINGKICRFEVQRMGRKWFVRGLFGFIKIYICNNGEFDVHRECCEFTDKAEAYGALASWLGRNPGDK